MKSEYEAREKVRAMWLTTESRDEDGGIRDEIG
jgi:hypothetical protein